MGRPKGSKNIFSTKINYICLNCAKTFSAFAHRTDVKFCSHKCYGDNLKGKPSLMYKGRKKVNKIDRRFWRNGRTNHILGYVLVHTPNHPNAINGKYVLEHRLVMEKHLGRYLKPEEVVHHINEIKDDNRIENLELCANRSEHMKRFH